MPTEPPAVIPLRAGDLKRRLDGGEPLTILDVREDDERAYAAIAVPPSAADLHIPMAQVSTRRDEIVAAGEAAPLVVYCHHGVRSMMVASWLASQGLRDIHNLEGGIDAWSRDVDPGVKRY